MHRTAIFYVVDHALVGCPGDGRSRERVPWSPTMTTPSTFFSSGKASETAVGGGVSITIRSYGDLHLGRIRAGRAGSTAGGAGRPAPRLSVVRELWRAWRVAGGAARPERQTLERIGDGRQRGRVDDEEVSALPPRDTGHGPQAPA